MKMCSKCNLEQDLTSFYRDKGGKDGYRNSCKSCDVKRRIAWSKANISNKTKDLVSKYKYRRKNPEKRKEYLEKLKSINPNYWAERAKAYREKDISTYRERTRKRDKFLRQTDPIYKLRRAISNRINQVVSRGGFTKRSGIGTMIGCSWIDFKIYLESKFTEGMSWDNYGKWHIDHIVPCASAQSEEDLIRLQHFTNLQPLWATDNLRKSDKV